MATQSPFSLANDLFERVTAGLRPPAWAVLEAQRRVVLVLNHVLQQEPQASAQLKSHIGKTVQANWRDFSIHLVVTRAGLFDLAQAEAVADLTVTFSQTSPWDIAQSAIKGDKPDLHIEGDAQFASAINWLVDNLRWEAEEDLARVIGDAPAHALGQAARAFVQALRRFVAKSTPTRGVDASGGGPGGDGPNSGPRSGPSADKPEAPP